MNINREKKAFLLKLAKRQRRLIYFSAACLVSLLLANAVPQRHDAIPNILGAILFVWSLVCMFKLVNLRYGLLKATIAVILSCVPIANLAFLAVVIALINSYFVSLGFRPGIIGVNPDVIDEL